MTLADNIIAEARTFKGTKFQHQGRLKNVGIDCVGFISEVAKNVGVGVEIPANYHLNEDGKVMLKLLKGHMKHVAKNKMKPGDVLALCDEALREPKIPRHLAFVTEVRPETIVIIHASQHGVKEHRIDSRWRKRIHSVWRVAK